MIAFFSRAWHTYFGNAVAIRDYRSQLRGNKALWIWSVYLLFLIGLCGLAYSGIVSQGQQSISSLQGDLTNFYYTVMSMLGAVVSLAAPALTATAVTIEKQRRSLDLVFSAPVNPRYLLVGKLFGGFRYLVMLLVLALPVTAVCVVMGGATWFDVVGAFIVLLSSGILFLAMGLLISATSATTVSATISAYLFTVIYLVGTSVFSVILTAMRFSSMGASRSNEAMWTVTLNPFSAAIAAPTFTRVGSVEVPNWVFGLVFALAVSRLLLAGAGSALSPFGSAETRTLRIQGLIVAFLLAFLAAVPLAMSVLGAVFSAGATSPSGPSPDYFVALLTGVIGAALSFFVPVVACYGREDVDRRNRNDGLASIRGIFLGTPSGGLPYLMLLAIVIGLGVVLGVRYSAGKWPGFEFGSISIWVLGFLTLWWGLARYLSSFRLGHRGSKAAVMAVMILLLAVPVPIFFMIMASNWSSGDASTAIWRLHLLYPLSPEGVPVAWIYGLASGIVGVMMALLGEANLKRQGR